MSKKKSFCGAKYMDHISKLNIKQLANALSKKPYLDGFQLRDYSIAQHCNTVHEVSKKLYPNDLDLQLLSLMYESPKAYMLSGKACDEDKIKERILNDFGINLKQNKIIEKLNNRVSKIEKSSLDENRDFDPTCIGICDEKRNEIIDSKTMNELLKPMSSDQSKIDFLQRYGKCTGMVII